jgi:hypothetical protein
MERDPAELPFSKMSTALETWESFEKRKLCFWFSKTSLQGLQNYSKRAIPESEPENG